MPGVELQACDSGADLIRPGRAALMLGLSASTVTRFADEGRLESMRLASGHRRIRRASVVRLLAERAAAAAEIAAQLHPDDAAAVAAARVAS